MRIVVHNSKKKNSQCCCLHAAASRPFETCMKKYLNARVSRARPNVIRYCIWKWSSLAFGTRSMRSRVQRPPWWAWRVKASMFIPSCRCVAALCRIQRLSLQQRLIHRCIYGGGGVLSTTGNAWLARQLYNETLSQASP